MNLIKVFRNPKLALILGVFFMFISCNQDEIITNDSLEFETKSLKSKVKEDNDFSLLISKNIAFSKAFMKKLHDKALLNKKNFLFKNLNEKQILKELGMDKMFENHLNEINQFILAIKNRHPNINILKADDLSPIYEEIKKGLNTTNNIKHYILWINNKKNPDKLDKLFIKNEINKYFDINIDTKTTQNIKKRENIITYWINTSQNSSIKDILHTHIFTKIIE